MRVTSSLLLKFLCIYIIVIQLENGEIRLIAINDNYIDVGATISRMLQSRHNVTNRNYVIGSPVTREILFLASLIFSV